MAHHQAYGAHGDTMATIYIIRILPYYDNTNALKSQKTRFLQIFRSKTESIRITLVSGGRPIALTVTSAILSVYSGHSILPLLPRMLQSLLPLTVDEVVGAALQ